MTVVSTLADSYVDAAAQKVGSVAEMAAGRQSLKYAELARNYIFQPIAVKNLCPINISAMEFLSELGRRLSGLTGEERESAYLFQHVSVSIQRFNSVLLHGTFISEADPD